MNFTELSVTASRAMLQLLRLLVNSLYFTVSYNTQWTKQYDKKSKAGLQVLVCDEVVREMTTV